MGTNRLIVLPAAALVALWGITSPATAASSPDALINPGLGAVVSLSPHDAWAVGSNNEGPDETVLIEHWDGTAWKTEHISKLFGGLYSISAVSPTDIWAVGYSTATGTAPYLTLTMHWDGTSWSQIPSPNITSDPANNLFGVSARITNDVWATGNATTRRAEPRAIAIHWNGTVWSRIERVGSPSSPVQSLDAVTTPTSRGALAVGYCEKTAPHCPSDANSSAVYTHTAEGWAPVKTRNLGMLYGVSSAGASDTWAAGQRGVSYSSGQSWRHLATAIRGQLVSIDALTPAYVMAVGGSAAELWDGSSWKQVSTPGTGFTASVSLDSANDGWAVGLDGSGHLLFEHWDGATFTQYQDS